MEQELNHVNQSPPDCVYFRALCICHLPPSAGVPHPALWSQHIGQAQLMTHPQLSGNYGKDAKLVSVSPNFLFPPTAILCIGVGLLLSPSLLLHGHQSLHPPGISQLTYNMLYMSNVERWPLWLSVQERGSLCFCWLSAWMSESSSLVLIREQLHKKLWNVNSLKCRI